MFLSKDVDNYYDLPIKGNSGDLIKSIKRSR